MADEHKPQDERHDEAETTEELSDEQLEQVAGGALSTDKAEANADSIKR